MIYAVPCRGVMDPEYMLKTAGWEQGTRHATGPLNFAVNPMGSLLPHSARSMAVVALVSEPLPAGEKETELRLKTRRALSPERPDTATCSVALCDRDRDPSQYCWYRVTPQGVLGRQITLR
jgi:hypothetical protein